MLVVCHGRPSFHTHFIPTCAMGQLFQSFWSNSWLSALRGKKKCSMFQGDIWVFPSCGCGKIDGPKIFCSQGLCHFVDPFLFRPIPMVLLEGPARDVFLLKRSWRKTAESELQNAPAQWLHCWLLLGVPTGCSMAKTWPHPSEFPTTKSQISHSLGFPWRKCTERPCSCRPAESQC